VPASMFYFFIYYYISNTSYNMAAYLFVFSYFI